MRSLRNHTRKYPNGSYCPPMSNEEYSVLSPSDGNLWKVQCLRCVYFFSKRTIEAHLVSEHGFSTNVLRGWHIHRGAMASKNQHLANWSRFQLAWDKMHNSEQAPLQLALAAGPSPLLLLCGVRASRRQVTEKPTLNPKKRWKPSPHHRQQQDHLLTVFLKDVGGSKTFLLLKTASWLGWTNCKILRTKPLSP